VLSYDSGVDDEAVVRFWQSRFNYWQAQLAVLPQWAWIRRRRTERRIYITRLYIQAFPAEAEAVARANS
jgi:hypothetical protein